MSHTPHGPGWWQASDGLWYKPPPPPPPWPPPPGGPGGGRNLKPSGRQAFLDLLKAIQGVLAIFKSVKALMAVGAGATAAIVVVVVVVTNNNAATSVGPAPAPASASLHDELLTTADMGQAVGGSWSATVPAAGGSSSSTPSCPTWSPHPSQAVSVELTESLGAAVTEEIDSFPTTQQASQAYSTFVSSADNCSWEKTERMGLVSRFTLVPDSGIQRLDSASGVWDVEGAALAFSSGRSSHDGAYVAVRADKLVAFAYINVDTNNQPGLPTIEQNIAPTLANKIKSGG